jgi:DNA-binding XRE family transcriptional regulator
MRYTDEERTALVKKYELYRMDKKLSYREAAELVGVNQATISRWEDGKQLPHKVQCYQIEKIVKDFTPTLIK